MKKIMFFIMIMMILTGCQLPNPTQYTSHSNTAVINNIEDIKKVYENDIINDEQQLILVNLEQDIHHTIVDENSDDIIKTQLIQRYGELYKKIHQQNIDDFKKLIEDLANIDIQYLPLVIRQQYIVECEKLSNLVALQQFKQSYEILLILKKVNNDYRLNISNRLLK